MVKKNKSTVTQPLPYMASKRADSRSKVTPRSAIKRVFHGTFLNTERVRQGVTGKSSRTVGIFFFFSFFEWGSNSRLDYRN
ncbi:hypothetical protein FKM82_020646 [Ascaphus truei]